MKSPLLSIVIANYNYGRFLEEAIQSVLSQSCQDFELIIVDGGSTDNSVEIIKKYTDKIAWWCSEKDGGQSAAFNKGFAHARGRFLTWLNADDVMLPGTIYRVADEVKRYPECEWFIGGTIWCDANLFVLRMFVPHEFSTMRLKARQLSAGGPSSIFSRKLFVLVGGFDETLHFMMDTDLWYKFANSGVRYRRIKHYFWVYRMHELSKMAGRVVSPDDEMVKRRASQILNESATLKSRVGAPSYWRRLTRYVPVSITDAMLAFVYQKRWKGRHINQVMHEMVVKPKVALSVAMNEYIGGLALIATEVFAPNNWNRGTMDPHPKYKEIPSDVHSDKGRMADYVIAHGINVLYAQCFKDMLFYCRVARACRHRGPIPQLIVVSHSPGTWTKWMKGFCYLLISGFVSDNIVFLSSRIMRRWRWLLWLLPAKINHVPNPTDICRCQPSLRQELMGSDARNIHFTVGTVANIHRRKQQLVTIKAIKILLDKGYDVSVRFAGHIGDEEYMKEIEEYVNSNHLKDRVRFCGNVERKDVPSWLHKINAYICTSDSEVMPYSILEAISSGLPVVAHDIAGIDEQVKDGVSGVLVRSVNPDDYALALSSVFCNIKDMGCAARRLAVSQFSYEKYADRMLQVLR